MVDHGQDALATVDHGQDARATGEWLDTLMSERVDRGHPVTLVMALAIIAAALVGALYMMRRADARMSGADGAYIEPRIPVEVVVAAYRDVPRMVKARGFLSGIEEVTVPSEVAGRVRQRPVEEGAAVEAGDVLVVIDETFYRLAVQRAEAERQRAAAQQREAQSGVAQAEAQLAAAQAVQANRRDEFNRVETLHTEGNAPQIEYDRVLTALHTADADWAGAKASLERVIGQRATADALFAVSEAALADAQAQLERCVVRAPVSGRVNRCFVEAGEYAVMTAPLVELVRLDELKMNIAVSDREVALLHEFERAEVFVDAALGTVHAARMHHVAPKLDPLTKRFQVELRVDNHDAALLSGMYGEAVLYCGQLTGRMLVPRESVFRHYGVEHCLVIVEADGLERAELRRVSARGVFGRLDEVEMLDGLAEGERVITTRRRELHNGARIEVVAHGQQGVGTADERGWGEPQTID
jgi:multidrug resistance efflux pump